MKKATVLVNSTIIMFRYSAFSMFEYSVFAEKFCTNEKMLLIVAYFLYVCPYYYQV